MTKQSSKDIDYTIFRDSVGRMRTKSLFREYRHPKYAALFTLKDRDVVEGSKRYISLKRKYFEVGDPTEYQFSQAVFGSWDHWAKISKTPFLLPYVEEWRKELDVKISSMVFQGMKNLGSTKSPSAPTALKWLGEQKWKYASGSRPKRGRPSALEVEESLKQELEANKTIDQDFERVLGE
jgi:hypothetical protein